MRRPTIRDLHIKMAREQHAAMNPPHDTRTRNTPDYATLIEAAQLNTLADARRMRASMIEDAANKAEREAIGAAFQPVLERLSRVE